MGINENELRKGDKVIVYKPDDIDEFPYWAESVMDQYDGGEYTVRNIEAHTYEGKEYTLVRFEETDVFSFNISWLGKSVDIGEIDDKVDSILGEFV